MSEKSMASLRSSVGDIPAIIASILPDTNAGTRPSHSVLTITNSLPKPSAIFLAIWTSYPPAYSLLPSIGTAPLEASDWVQLNGA